MKDAGTKSRQLKALRHRAETILREEPQALSNIPPEDIQQLIHEMQVHQIELEMQNEELRRTQLQLGQTRDKYSDLYNFAPVGYFTLDKNARVVEANLTGANLLIVERRSLINSSFTRFIAPDCQDSFYLHRRRVFESATRQTCELKLLKKDGTEFYGLLESIAVPDAEGNSKQFRTAITDITKQRHTEMVLRENEEKYRQHFENDSDAVMIFDAETGQFEDANQATLDLYGYSRDEFLALNVEDISAEKEKTRSNVKKIRGGGAFAKRVPLRYFDKKDGTVFPGEISAGRFTIDGRLKIIGAVRDISERQRLLDELERSEEFSRSLLMNAPNPIIVFAPDTSVKYVNPAFEKLSGYRASEILAAKVPHPWWIEELLSQTGKDFDKLFKTANLDLKQAFRKKNGEKFWVEISSKPVRKGGELIYHLSSWIDITKRRQAQGKLKASEKKYRTLADNIPIGVAHISPAMEILTINNQMRKWFPDINLDKTPLCYQTFNDPPGEGVCAYCPTIQTLQDGQVHESLTETPAGDEISRYRIISSPVIDADGKVVSAIEMAEDVTDRLQMEKALQDSERRFKSIFENAPIGFYRTTPDGRILDANPVLIHMLGYASFEELAAVNLKAQDYHPEYSRRDFREHIERDGEIKGMESFWKRSDGTSVYIRENARAIRGSDGKVVCYEGTLEDISDQKQANDQVRILSQQLIKAQEDERRMISRELHDRVAQDLSTLLIGLDTLFDQHPNVIPEARKKALAFSEILKGTIGAVRDLSYDLLLPGLDDMGLIPALSMYCEEFAEKNSLKVDFQATGMSALRLDFDTEMNLYRLIQEGLNNIRRHAAAGQAFVKLVGTYPNIILRIEDDGKGFDVEERTRSSRQ